ncbi:TlpA disulfide reductase family protein [Schumannella luteola]|uniref:Thiol-disulfide isomerase/thioredoxin n=1 Tax=Schumannella luteola TaxID=472059 RepID=A0A852Y8E3_9MICO|nr:thiol-disulfide isomerase/thioredoxin [Schumannella luteola]TPX01577.1 TlpA family protein disulfide reductase [Schumannella luteola]
MNARTSPAAATRSAADRSVATGRPATGRRRILVAVPALAAAAALVLAGCTAQGDSLSKQYRENAGKNYVSSDGSTQTFSPDKRKDAVVYQGTTPDGDTITSKSLEGKVAVLNFWYASCGPCRIEAPDLKKLSDDYGDTVSFLGVNVRDDGATAQTFEKKYELAYPTLLDAGDNEVQLAFAGSVSANAVPTTLVIDQQGRVAARFSGRIQSPDVLKQIIDDTVAEAK